jgi:hypothetical protein
MGVTAGAYILTLFAMKYRERVLGMIWSLIRSGL